MAYDIIIGRDKNDKILFGDSGLIYLGKSFVKMGNYNSLSNKLWMDVARSHVVLIAGKRGTGKCLHGDTLITLSDGSLLPIKDLEKNDKEILSLNDQLKINKTKKNDFFSRKVNRLLKIKLRSGKEIKLTPEHPLLTIKGWEEAQKLTIGSRVATPRVLNAFGNNEMPEHEIKLLAYLIAEGHTKKVVLFSNSDEKIVNEFNDSLKKLDPSLELIKEKESHYRISSPKWKTQVIKADLRRDEQGHFLKGTSNLYEKRSIRKLIEKESLFGLLSKEKYLSQNVLTLKKESLSMFLNRLFSCDGSIYCKNNSHGKAWQISYCSSSERMIRQIQNLLLRFDILSKLREKKINFNGKTFNSFELVLDSINILKFINEIGFYGKKEEKQRIAKEELIKKIVNPNVDTIPKGIWEMYKPQNWAEIGRALGYAHPKAMREKIHYSPSRQTLLQIAEVESNNSLLLLAQSDIFWDEITRVELLEGEFTVYDISVPESHNFVANDIIVHNSYTLGSIAEELSNLPEENAKNISSLIFDTMGIFWTMKYPNEKDKVLLEEWGLKSKSLPVKVFIPFGKTNEYQKKGIPIDNTFALKASELESEDWTSIFNLDLTSPAGVLIQKVITDLKKVQDNFTLVDIQERVAAQTSALDTKEIVSSLFSAADNWGIFTQSGEGTEIRDLITAGTTTVLDVSVYSSISIFNIRALVINLILRKLFNNRMDARRKEETESIQYGQDYMTYKSIRREPLVWVFIDEAHEFLPREGKTPATDALIQVLREGRQPGLSLVLATQQPGQIHKDVMTQSDIVISHRVTSKQDIEALNEIMQTYVLDSIRKQMDDLPALKGSAIILDDNSERIYPARIRPKFTWHGGEAPSSIKAERIL